MAQLAIGDTTKEKLTGLRQQYRQDEGPDNLSYDQFLQVLMNYWEQGHVEPEEEG